MIALFVASFKAGYLKRKCVVWSFTLRLGTRSVLCVDSYSCSGGAGHDARASMYACTILVPFAITNLTHNSGKQIICTGTSIVIGSDMVEWDNFFL